MLHTGLDIVSGTGQAVVGKHDAQVSKRHQNKKLYWLCGETGHLCKDCLQKIIKAKHKVKSAIRVSQRESWSDIESDNKAYEALSHFSVIQFKGLDS